MTRRRLSLMLVVLLLAGVVVAVGVGTAVGQTVGPSSIELSTSDPNPPAGATVTITARVDVGDGVVNPSDPYEVVDLVAGLGTRAEGTVGLMEGSGYPQEVCHLDPNPTAVAFTTCVWHGVAGVYVFTFPVTIDPDAQVVSVIADLYGGPLDDPHLAQDILHISVFQEETTTTTSTTTSTSTTTTTPTTTTSITVAPTSIVTTTVAASTTIAEVETDIVDGGSMNVAVLGLVAIGVLTLAAAAVRARRFDR